MQSSTVEVIQYNKYNNAVLLITDLLIADKHNSKQAKLLNSSAECQLFSFLMRKVPGFINPVRLTKFLQSI